MLLVRGLFFFFTLLILFPAVMVIALLLLCSSDVQMYRWVGLLPLLPTPPLRPMGWVGRGTGRAPLREGGGNSLKLIIGRVHPDRR